VKERRGVVNTAPSTPVAVQVGPAISYAPGQGRDVSERCGGCWSGKIKGANHQVKMLLVCMIVLFVPGLAIISIAPLQAAK